MMADATFSPLVREALDSYIVPPVPSGFTQRLISRIESGDTLVSELVSHAGGGSQTRRFIGNPWRRSGRIIGSVAFLSLATATAAAAGIFGDPVYMPGISEALAEADVVALPSQAPVAQTAALAEKSSTPAIGSAGSFQQQTPGAAAIVDRVSELRHDPAYIALPVKERLKVARDETRALIRSGQATKADARAAARELIREIDPTTREKIRAAATERRQARLPEGSDRPTARLPQEGIPDTAVAESPVERKDLGDAAGAVEETLADNELGKIPQEQKDALRERFREASPEQRAQIRQALRERRLMRTQRPPR